jgi:ABC-type dipeptide/oligopeptide/nickel transport system ATPase component
MNVIRSVADKIIVLEKGKVIEEGSIRNIFDNPKNIYTKKLLKSII